MARRFLDAMGSRRTSERDLARGRRATPILKQVLAQKLGQVGQTNLSIKVCVTIEALPTSGEFWRQRRARCDMCEGAIPRHVCVRA
eukprot:CAMPEP_0117569390 /NCGR_PEP_ID=MMETSP0784-20121206/58632_1 /TAXON_ID=39447 /ORGANISM="" /LENGTH=85 /DNA_ID=CAMNT_0005367359 /DNA_START=260 /DNA_END=514 /DNA_ORIENTATION=-